MHERITCLDDDEDKHESPNEDSDIEYIVYHAACYIRKAISDMKPLMALPPKSENIAVCNLEIPTILYNFVAWIVSPKELDYVKDRDVEVSESASRKVSSIAQDVINCATNA
jgi:hypothetical protein